MPAIRLKSLGVHAHCCIANGGEVSDWHCQSSAHGVYATATIQQLPAHYHPLQLMGVLLASLADVATGESQIDDIIARPRKEAVYAATARQNIRTATAYDGFTGGGAIQRASCLLCTVTLIHCVPPNTT